MNDRLLSVGDVCKYLGISRDTAYKWIEKRGLPAYRLGRLWKFKRQEIDNWVKKTGKANVSRRQKHESQSANQY